MKLDGLSIDEKEELYTLLALKAKKESETRLSRYKPYKKQAEFHNTISRERLFMAGNQIGKTYCSANEIAYHLTGIYPDWWEGRRFDTPTVGWAAGVTGESTRDTLQRLVMGRPGQIGTGSIPKALIEDHTMARGVADAIDTVLVKHVGGGLSQLAFKSYEKGREKWQGETLHFVAFDEEPPLAIYTEGLTRTNATNGIVWTTFTPLLGMSEVVKRFLIDKTQGTKVISATIDDAEHYTAEQRQAIIAGYPEHEREARAKGIPVLGSGRVFPVAEEMITVGSFPIPTHWPRIIGLDFGWGHKTAAVWLAWDRDSDTVYVTDVHAAKETPVIIHAATIRAKGDWIPVAWPHDGLQHDKGSGEQLANQYREQGVAMLKERVTFENGGNGVEAGVADMLTRMQTGRLKVFSHLTEWLEEFRLYHRKDGLLVKIDDDIMAATRYGIMMLRKAQTHEQANDKVRSTRTAPTLEYNVFDETTGY